MALKGIRIGIFGQPPTTAGGENPFELVLPVHERLINGHLTPLGAWECRPGYETAGTTGGSAAVVAIIPSDENVAILADGSVYRSKGRWFTGFRALTGGMTGHARPVWCQYDGAIIVADGGEPQVIESQRTRRLGSDAKVPGAPTVTDIGGGRIIAGTYRYAVTLVTAAGESLPGAEASPVTVPAVGGGRFRVALPSLTDDERRGVTGWKAYRRQDNEWGLVGTATLDQAYIEDGAAAVGAAPQSYDATESLPPRFRWVTTVGDYVVGGGHDATEFRWCAEGAFDRWPELNFTNAQLDGDVVMGVGLDKDLYLFKTRTVEVWALVGGTTVFARRGSIPRGCWAPLSVVMVDGRIPHWLGEDGCFYRLNGNTPEPIGALERRRVATLARPQAMRGDYYPEEGVIRWTCEGESWTYDYRTKSFSEDAAWDGAGFRPLPVECSALVSGKTYVGLPGGLIGRWGRDVYADGGERIRTVRRFTVPTTKDGRRARVNALTLRLDVGRSEAATDTDPAVTVRWGFDGGLAAGSHRIELPTQGAMDPYRTFGPLGMGREIWVELERGASAPFSVMAGFIVANPTGDGSAP